MNHRLRDNDPRVHHTCCNLCEAICGITVSTENHQIEDIRGDKDDPLSQGYVCPKSISLTDITNDPDRLRRPVRRTATGWAPMDWPEAIDLVASRLAEVQRQHGANSVAVYLGNPTVHSLGAMTHGTAFSSSLGTHNHFSPTSADQLPHQLISSLLYGHQLLLPIPDVDRTEHLLMFGANPRASNGSMMTAPNMARRIREIRSRGGRVTVVDPRVTETAKICDEHIFIRPGTDAAVLLAMVNIILSERDPQIPAYALNIDAVREAVSPFTAEVASAYSRVPAQTIRRLALAFADAKSAACYGRIGISTQRYGTLCHWAVQMLNIITGNLGRKGGTLFTDPAVNMLNVVPPGSFGKRHSRVRGLPSFGPEFPVSVLAEEISTPGEGQIRALVVHAGNPVLSVPDGVALDKACADLDFMVSVDLYVNETSRHADVILPPTTALEREHYDLIFRTFAVRNTAKFTPAVLPKPEGAKHDWEIFRDLAASYRKHRYGTGLRGLQQLIKQPRLVARLRSEVQLRSHPGLIIEMLLRTGPYRLSLKKLRHNPSGLDLGPLREGVERKLRTKSRTVDLLPDLIRHNIGDLLRDTVSNDDGDALMLIGRRHLRSNNSWGHNYERMVSGRPRHHLLMHPNDAVRCQVGDGPATLTSRVGTIQVDVLQTDEIMEGTVSLPHGFGHGRPNVQLSTATQVGGASINDVTDPQRVDLLSGNAALCGVPVTVEPIR